MEKSNWSHVLSTLYDSDGKLGAEVEGISNIDDWKPSGSPKRELSRKLIESIPELDSTDNARDAIELLETADLVNIEEGPYTGESNTKLYHLRLTREGFSVAHDRQMENSRRALQEQMDREQNDLTKRTVRLTAVLAVAAGLDAFVTVFQSPQDELSLIMFGIVVSFLIIYPLDYLLKAVGKSVLAGMN